MTLGKCGNTDFAGATMNKTDLMLAFAVCLTTAAQADDLTPTTDYSSGFNYYGENQPFAHPVPLSLSTVPPRSYIPTAPGRSSRLRASMYSMTQDCQPSRMPPCGCSSAPTTPNAASTSTKKCSTPPVCSRASAARNSLPRSTTDVYPGVRGRVFRSDNAACRGSGPAAVRTW